MTLVGERSSVLGAGGRSNFVARNNNNSAFFMSDLKKASDRLEQAVDRLDKALANGQASRQDAHAPALARAITAVERERDTLLADLEALRVERTRLTRALAEATERQAATRQANEAVAERLDDAIGSLRGILGV
ncbi:MAG: DUF4164 family protein [Rhodospirillales bacterium]|nr:DUF4164 family protein [Rhodospirillales bacterium]